MEFDTIWVVSWDVLRPTAPWAMLLLLLLLRAAAALPHFLVPAEPGRRHVYVGVGSTPSDLAWMQRQEVHLEVRYRPLLVQPHPHLAPELGAIAEARGGAFYPNVAWTRDGMKMRLGIGT